MFKVSCFYHKVHNSLKFLEYAALLYILLILKVLLVLVLHKIQERQQLIKSMGTKQSCKIHFYCKNLNSYGHLMKSVGATAPTAPLILAPMLNGIASHKTHNYNAYLTYVSGLR